MDIELYVTERVDTQLKYFDSSAVRSQQIYKWLKGVAIACNILTTLTIALTFTVQDDLKVIMGIIALAFSIIVLATYQIEEFYNFGARWEKFRLVAEEMKSEKYMFINGVGAYAAGDPERKKRLFIEKIEGIIQGTDISYFSLIAEPGKRTEKRLQ